MQMHVHSVRKEIQVAQAPEQSSDYLLGRLLTAVMALQHVYQFLSLSGDLTAHA